MMTPLVHEDLLGVLGFAIRRPKEMQPKVKGQRAKGKGQWT